MMNFMRIFLIASVAVTGCTTLPPSPPVTVEERAPATEDGFQPLSSAVRRPTEPLIAVGLLTDQAEIAFPRTTNGYHIVSDAGRFFTTRGFTARAPLAGETVRYGVQVGAISDTGSAEAMKRRIESEQRTDVVLVFDAATGMNRVIAGSFATADEARPFREILVSAGWPSDSMIVPRPSTTGFTPAVHVVDDEGQSRTFSGTAIEVLPASGDEIRIGDAPYRGLARLHVNARGLFNVINTLNLDDYVKGVIPSEMGPRIYDELEAQKAQALAARTYAVRRLGDYRNEGFDICPTPACQVYKGKGTEQELSNRAVEETAGLVITHSGRPIDALFSATCGGATSDVDVMFPGRNDPYLRHTSCVEREMRTVRGRTDGALLDSVALRARLFEAVSGQYAASSSWSGGDVAAVTGAALRHAGVTREIGRPASSRRRDVYRWLHDVWGLKESTRLLLLDEDIRYFFPSHDPRATEIRTAAWLVKFEFLPFQMIDRLDLDAAIPRDEMLGILYSWLTHLQRVDEVRGRIRSIDGRRVSLKTDSGTTQYELAPDATVLRQMGDRAQELSSAPVIIGDRATAVRSGGRIVALIVEANYDGAAFDRTSAYSGWVRSYREDSLVKAISRRNPVRDLEELRVVSRDEAGRVRELHVVADGGRAIPLKGLPIRWSLDTPDNLFTIHPSSDPDGASRWTFYGKGWGHGVGMCQVGAFGMAFRGHTATEIIQHYYRDVEIVPLSSVSSR